MSRLSLFLLGQPRIEKDGVPIEVDTRKAIALLTYMATSRGAHSRDSLVNLLWPDYDQTRGRAVLSRTLSALNKALAGAWLKVNRGTVGLSPDADIWLDVDEFRSLLTQCRKHGHPSTEACPRCVKPLTEAVELYRDHFLSGFSLKDSVNFDDWQSSQTQSLRSEMVGALERLVRCRGERGEFEKAIGYANRWLEIDQTDEGAHRHLMESYARSGRRAAALRQYDECLRVLERELGTSPQEETIQLYEAIKENRVQMADSKWQMANGRWRISHQLRGNLPFQLTSFIGREREIAEVKRLLTTTRLLTLTGAGGCGKTRLALQVAADLAEEYTDGVWLVELAALSDPALVPQEVASALGVSEQIGRPIVATLSDYLKSKHLLLVMDNCEHIVGACAALAEALLRSCPNLRILATSRERLGIAGETAWRVPSLSTPDPFDGVYTEHSRSAQDKPQRLSSLRASALTQYEASRLFIDRAMAALPGFTVTDRNAPMLAQICHRLDGIPLAIELAAARVKGLSVEQINERLDDRFRLLTGGSRTALPRHQTLLATMDWSYGLLSEAERVLLNRLSVFAGGWTLVAAEAVCADVEANLCVRPDEVFDLMMGLVNKSLVVVDEKGDEVRYRLLGTVRQYGWEKLVEAGEESVLRGRHLDWFLALSEKAEPELRRLDQIALLDRLEVEHDNLRAALEWSLGGGEIEAGLRLAGAIGPFWFVRGYWSEGRWWLEKALSRGTSASASARSKALGEAGRLAFLQYDHAHGKAQLEESLALSRELGDRWSIAQLLGLLGFLATSQGDYGRAVALGEEGIALFREIEDKWGIANSLNILGFVAQDQGDYGRVAKLCEESLALSREIRSKWCIAWSLHLLGSVARYQGDYSRAAELWEESLILFREMDMKNGIGGSLALLGNAAEHQGDYERAWALYKESLPLSRGLGNRMNVAMGLGGLARVVVAQGQPERAAWLYGAAEALLEAMGAPLPPSERPDYDRGVAAVRAGLGEEAFAEAWEEGRKMTVEEAIQLAMMT